MTGKTVVVGLLGSKLDQTPSRLKQGQDRWADWRPTIGICQQEDFVVDRLELLFDPKNATLLAQVVNDIAVVSPETQVETHEVPFKDPWDFEEVYSTLYEFTENYAFEVEKEEYFAHITTGSHVAQICLFLLTESRHLPAALLQSSPPARRSKYARGTWRAIDLDLSKYDRIASRFAKEQQEGYVFLKAGIETRNAAFNGLIEKIERVVLATREPILLSGPTGAGKSQLAKRIFELKRSRQQVVGEFVAINCATLRGEHAMSTLFGHTKGAYTGAVSARPGLLRAADQGVLFLDEIGELGLDEQAMLLRATEEKSFLPVGSDHVQSSDFQLLAGSNRNLYEAVQDGRFREDLLARINLWHFELPGLRQRREDIEPNVEYELQQYATRSGRKVTFNKEAHSAFMDFAQTPQASWNGNFRDLNAAITRMATLAANGRITVPLVREEIARLMAAWNASRPSGSKDGADSTKLLQAFLGKNGIDKLDEFDRVQLASVLQVCQRATSMSAAGRELFQVSRQAKSKPNDADRLRKYLAKFGIEWSHFQRT